ncbi:XrtA/PEP-CTERM system amidotransferase [Aliivibrio kagoshimensis]|uniref:XrtA/PEP-CTERM system amidotransferase n=1 Tax=Aliivibrio kagoshimensis TaxID=2910230 RepID=UPI003D0D1FC6
MCGISGIYNLSQPHPIDLGLLKHINNVQFHRGPDDEGYFVDPYIGLGHRRLSIIDLAGGHQPQFNEDGSVAIVFNGEIYNYPELVTQLKQKGHVFSSESDTEVIVHAWEEWGVECVKKLDGMFTFAVWDQNSRQLFIARDRLGKKALFYTVTSSGQLIFGSELKVILAHPDVDHTLREEMAEEFFMYGYIPDPYTAYKNIHKLEQGHYIHHSAGWPFTTTAYWDLTLSEHSLSFEETQEQLISRLTTSVSNRMMSDVPLGAFLSGGVDSSAIVALMAGQHSEPVNTFSIGFNEKAFDESEYAEQIANRYHTNHKSQIVDPNDISLVEKLIDIYDEPFADSSALPTFRVCQLARQSVKVALSGDGGDELFGGYRRYRMHMAEQRVRDMVPNAIRKPIFGTLGKLYPKADWAPQPLRAKTTFESIAMTAVEGYGNTISKLRHNERSALFHPSYLKSLHGYTGVEILKQHGKNAPTTDPLKLIQYLDTKTWLVGDILTKVDRASMANSLEVRAPLLDHKFWEWGFNTQSSNNVKGNQGKYAFKKSLESLVGDDILYRPKMGFSMPISTWFRTSLKHTLPKYVLSDSMLDSGLFDQATLQKMVSDHSQGYKDHGASLWCLLMFSLFMDKQ